MSFRERIEAEVAKLGPIATAGYFLAIRLKGASPLMTFSTFPTAWTDAYMENGYMMRDPVTTWALTVGGSIRWSSPFLFDPFGVFKEAAKHGLFYGASVAYGPVRSLTLCSLSRGDRELTDDEIATAKSVVIGLHDMTELPAAIESMDAQILLLAEKHQSPSAIAKSVGAGEAQIRDALERLCDAFLSDTPADAARRARDLKLL